MADHKIQRAKVTSIANKNTHCPRLLDYFDAHEGPIADGYRQAAQLVYNAFPDMDERNMALRKLLESYDCVIRCSLDMSRWVNNANPKVKIVE